jgi:chromosome segregation ATPase
MSSPLRGRSKSPLYKANVSCTRSYSQLRIDVDVLCERLAASEAAKERYIKKYTTLNENYRALCAHNAKEEQLKEHTVSRWKEDHSALKDCRAELQSKSREIAAVRTECESLRSELGLMRSQFESSEKVNSSTHTRLRESENLRQQTERQNSELSINLDSYRKIRAELTDSLKDKDERLLAAHQMIAEFETQLRHSDEAKRQLELQVEEVTASARLALQHSQIEVRQRLHIGLEAVQESERQKSALQESSDNLARSYQTLRDDFASLEQKLSALQRSKDAADEEIKLQQRELQQVRDEARHSISKSFEDVGQIEKDLRAHYASKFSNAEAEIESLRARHAKLSEASQQALEDMQMVVMRNEHDIKTLQQSHAALQNDRSAAIEAHALSSSRLKDAESQIVTLKSHLDEANADVKSLKASLSASDAERKALKLSLDQHKDSCMQATQHTFSSFLHPVRCSHS